MEKKNKFIEYKKCIIRAIDKSMSFIKENTVNTSCCLLSHYLDCCGVRYDFNKYVLHEYRKVCRARRKHRGFRDYTNEQWSNKSQEEQQKIRIKKLEKFKKHFIVNY